MLKVLIITNNKDVKIKIIGEIDMKDLINRFVKYAKIYTTSDEESNLTS